MKNVIIAVCLSASTSLFAGNVAVEKFATEDTFILRAFPTTWYGHVSNPAIRRSISSVDSQAFIRFNLGLPSGAVIVSAELRLHKHSGHDSAGIVAYQAPSTWSGGSTWSTIYVSSLGGLTSGARTGAHKWNVTDIVKNWHAGQTNNGFVLSFPAAGTFAEFKFHSKEAASNERPSLHIVYNMPCQTTSVVGDADGDGQCQFSDFLILNDSYGQAGGWSDGDFDCSGTVDFDDFLILAENYGYPSGPVTPHTTVGTVTYVW